jgi:three-Cys-motif partner protein
VLGSPSNALLVEPPFREYYLVDLNPEKTDELRDFASRRPDVHIYTDDCNAVLVEEVFPRVRYDQYKRGLCLLDPYGLHLNWDIIFAAGQSRAIEIFLNFPVMDMNMNVLHRNPDDVDPKQADRMTAFWGDTSWKEAAYSTEGNLFGYEEKLGNEEIAEAFRKRLRDVAGFTYVPRPIPMRNSTGSIVYYLFFASRKPVAANIVTDIFNKYRNKGAQ